MCMYVDVQVLTFAGRSLSNDALTACVCHAALKLCRIIAGQLNKCHDIWTFLPLLANTTDGVTSTLSAFCQHPAFEALRATPPALQEDTWELELWSCMRVTLEQLYLWTNAIQSKFLSLDAVSQEMLATDFAGMCHDMCYHVRN